MPIIIDTENKVTEPMDLISPCKQPEHWTNCCQTVDKRQCMTVIPEKKGSK